MSIRCVLFDLDNTLLGIPDTYHYFDDLIQLVVNTHFHLPIPSQEERDTLWRTGKEYISILKAWGITDSVDFWHQFDIYDDIQRKKLISQKQLIEYDDVKPILHQLHQNKILLGIVTNTPTSIAMYELQAYQFVDYFGAIIGLGDNPLICKPEPDGIHKALNQLHCSSSEAIYVGDSSIDIIAAQNANVLPFLLQRKSSEPHLLHRIPTQKYHHISSLYELISFVLPNSEHV